MRCSDMIRWSAAEEKANFCSGTGLDVKGVGLVRLSACLGRRKVGATLQGATIAAGAICYFVRWCTAFQRYLNSLHFFAYGDCLQTVRSII